MTSGEQFRALMLLHAPLSLELLDRFKENFPICKVHVYSKVQHEKLRPVRESIPGNERPSETVLRKAMLGAVAPHAPQAQEERGEGKRAQGVPEPDRKAAGAACLGLQHSKAAGSVHMAV